MLALKTKKQKNILCIVFSVLFLASFVLVVIERAKITQYQIRTKEVAEKMNQSIVKGMSVEREAELTDYHYIIKNSLIVINKNIDLFLLSGDVFYEDIEQVYLSLHSCVVPEIYRPMHIKISSLAGELMKQSNADPEYLSFQREALFSQYPWLNDVLKK